MNIIKLDSHPTNWGDGKGGPGEHRGRHYVIVHGTGQTPDSTADGFVAWMVKPDRRVSYHYYIAKDGRAWQFVEEKARAWHAGISEWPRTGANRDSDLNDMSIGVAMESSNRADEVYTLEQVNTLRELLHDMLERIPTLAAERVLSHFEVSGPRKTDPVNFPMAALRAELAKGAMPKPEALGQYHVLVFNHLRPKDAQQIARAAWAAWWQAVSKGKGRLVLRRGLAASETITAEQRKLDVTLEPQEG